MRLYYFTDIDGLTVERQKKMAEAHGYENEPRAMAWTDTAKSFPANRARMLKALRSGYGDEVWVAILPVLAANRRDLRYVVNELETVGASVLEGHSGWISSPRHEGRMYANCLDFWDKRRVALDDPREKAVKVKNGSRPMRMPECEARTIWLDPTILTDAMAIERINSDPRYRKEWTSKTAWRIFGRAGRTPGRRPLKSPPIILTDE